MRRKWLLVVIAPFVIFGLFVGVLWLVNQKIKHDLSGPMHVFQLREKPTFLSDDLAVSKTQEALALDGYNLAAWKPMEDRRTKAPDGTVDIYFCRSTINANEGYTEFWNEGKKTYVFVHAALKGDKLKCQVWLQE